MNQSHLAHTLDELTGWIEQYVVFPNSHCAAAIALWIAHTWRSTDFYTTPAQSLPPRGPAPVRPAAWNCWH